MIDTDTHLSINESRTALHYATEYEVQARLLRRAGGGDAALAVALREAAGALRAAVRASDAVRREQDAAKRRERAESDAARDRRERERAEQRAAAVAWLRERLTRPARRADVEHEAAEAGHGAALSSAMMELDVQEIDGKFLFGTSSPEAGVTYLQAGFARPGTSKPAA